MHHIGEITIFFVEITDFLVEFTHFFVKFTEFFVEFTHFFVDFCRDRRLRASSKIFKILASRLFFLPCLSQILSSTPVQKVTILVKRYAFDDPAQTVWDHKKKVLFWIIQRLFVRLHYLLILAFNLGFAISLKIPTALLCDSS